MNRAGNKYAGKCHRCGLIVEPGQGPTPAGSPGAWQLAHWDCIPVAMHEREVQVFRKSTGLPKKLVYGCDTVEDAKDWVYFEKKDNPEPARWTHYEIRFNL